MLLFPGCTLSPECKHMEHLFIPLNWRNIKMEPWQPDHQDFHAGKSFLRQSALGNLGDLKLGQKLLLEYFSDLFIGLHGRPQTKVLEKQYPSSGGSSTTKD